VRDRLRFDAREQRALALLEVVADLTEERN